MKTFIFLFAFIILSAAASFAENPSHDTQRNDTAAKTTAKASEYKSSPRLSYHSNKPSKEDLNLEGIKPMLNQALGNNQNGSAGGALMPTAGTYSF
ncbi:hypothetical protein [Solidesulfovibrio fructosivorans]|uniref:hypothetical protein n=1 Tax=Solidesulfovibrio fructosivorans TaxID=878 RepID=UPI00117F8287|nr:hypothetical protein [Solidesulfovibrio fructosivorans]